MFKYVAFFLLILCAQQSTAQQRVKVSVYYESLCPDSIKFFTKQLYPTLQRNISKYLDLTLIPFGKSTQTFNQNLNQWEFECHHGPDECYGNKIQACAMHRIDNGRMSNGLGYNKVLVAFINCLMDRVKRNPFELPTRDCATLNNVPNLMDIENCANHTDGSSLLSNLGHLTEKLTPKLTSVPTITFNNVYKEEENQMAQSNFQKALCMQIKDNLPSECQMSGADRNYSNLFASIGFIVISVVFKNSF